MTEQLMNTISSKEVFLVYAETFTFFLKAENLLSYHCFSRPFCVNSYELSLKVSLIFQKI